MRYTLELHFSGEEEREAFSKRLSAVRQLLSPGTARVDNTALMSALFDAVEETSSSQPTGTSSSCTSFQRNSGI